MNKLSDRAKQLIPQARIVSFIGWSTLTPEGIAHIKAADDTRQYLTDEDLAAIAAKTSTQSSEPSPEPSPEVDTIAIVKQLRNQAADIVDEAKADVLKAFPGILEPGGDLYPTLRGDACWRDFWHFLRCITYGIAGQNRYYTSPSGLGAMKQLYQELQVPLPAMVVGLKGIKQASLKRLPADTHQTIVPYFDHLIEKMMLFVRD